MSSSWYFCPSACPSALHLQLRVYELEQQYLGGLAAASQETAAAAAVSNEALEELLLPLAAAGVGAGAVLGQLGGAAGQLSLVGAKGKAVPALVENSALRKCKEVLTKQVGLGKGTAGDSTLRGGGRTQRTGERRACCPDEGGVWIHLLCCKQQDLRSRVCTGRERCLGAVGEQA